MKFLFPFLFLIGCNPAFAQQSATFQKIHLIPTSLPAICYVGDVRVSSSTNHFNQCSSSNTWTEAGSVLSSPLPTSSGGTGQSSNLTQYGVIYAGSSTAMASSSGGTAGYVFMANNSSAPTFQQLNIASSSDISGVLPRANGGTNNGSLAVTAGGVIYTDGTMLQNVGAGTFGFFLKSNGASAPTWVAASGGGTASFDFFASSDVTSSSSSLSGGSWATFSNSPGLDVVATYTGTYKVYASIPIDLAGGAPGQAAFRIINTSGSATLSAESQAGEQCIATVNDCIDTLYIQSIYNLTSGNTYIFNIQGKVIRNATSLILDGTDTPFFMFSERVK